MKRNLYVSAAASVVLMAGGPVAAAAAASADTARTVPAATAARGDVTAEAAIAAALKNYPGVVESLDRDGNVWHVDVITKDGKGHAELEVDAATGAVTRQNVDTGEDSSEHKELLAAKVTAGQAGKAAVAAHPGQVWTVEWDADDNGKAPYWHVEVRGADGKTWDASVDPTTGKATAQSDSDGDSDSDSDGGNG
ncbi:PepSY domain-containing protein [Streptomyces sp. NBC_00162]|uniref:PepSY domain-containing protein n=1 Tax=Streptomyces sp. NBC_00162 TaxID=2903629 RepID=UPI00214B74A6|nr:PepSY domain-containing protein [Streptomyces sp. NBC_00162]UUU39937.1 PepSY domain-containing protein [Streptomyces sp. NBC_00162]